MLYEILAQFWALAQSMKFLPCKHEVPTLILRTTLKTGKVACGCNPSAGKTEIPGTSWPASLA